ncbi:hypothetical protein BDN70DRAFT_56494 [Pholiota conissans]|uniref:Nephrocystin 3-like N-terminal domain-containing protein n=1 Tax=Pholiota conissans TaxID=109636 RepID=A0A9P5ZBU4_9AGAR|nr:hypothetical protein BDN70DRAFT_56494 [Pholiota conissans]
MFNGAKNLVITGGTFTHYNVESSGLEILHKQTAPSAFHNSGERFDPPKCHPNTRVAVLNRIMDWVLAVASFDALIMWLYGPAGAGKSAIAQTIAEQCFERGLLLASFFFSRNDHNRNRSKPLIATLAYQTALTVPDARTHIESAVKKDPAIFERSLEAQLEALIFDPLRQLCDAGFFNLPNFPRLIIIDGLDECGESQMQCNILRSIANVVNKQRLPIVFLVCSRPEQHISIEFNTGILNTITTRVVLDDTFLPEDDIRLFLKDSCETIKATHPLKKFIPSTWPESASVDVLVTKSSGQFIYASTVIKDIGHPRRRPTERLDVILGLRASRNMMPFAELDALYMHILSSIEDIAGALEILGTLFVPRLQVGEEATKIREPRYLEEMLDLSPGDVYLTLVDLSSLLNCEQHEAPIQVFHASLGDFLLDKDRSKQFHIDIASAHAHMAHLCLQHLKNKTVGFPLNYTYGYLVEHTLNAAPTEQLHDDLLNCSLVHSVYATSRENPRTSYHWDIRYLLPKFVGRVKTLVRTSFSFLRHVSDRRARCSHLTMRSIYTLTTSQYWTNI